MEYKAEVKAFNADATNFFSKLSQEEKEEMVYKRLSIGNIEFIEMYRDDGKAKPLMFVIHGGPGRKEQVLDWVKRYSHEGFYTIALDVAVHGEDNREPMLCMNAWLETVGDIDTLIEYARTLKQADANRFCVGGFSMGGTITFLYGAKGKYTPSVLLPEIGTPDIVGLLNGRANGVMGQNVFAIDTLETLRYFLKKYRISECDLSDESKKLIAEAMEELTKRAREISPFNYIERFIDIPMYAKFGGNDDPCGVAGVRLFNEKLKEAGATIQKLTILEGYGHGGFPDDFADRLSYIKKHMGMEE